jgi:hypothetical protein
MIKKKDMKEFAISSPFKKMTEGNCLSFVIAPQRKEVKWSISEA